MIDIDRMVFNTLTGTRGMRMERVPRVDMSAYKGPLVVLTEDLEFTVQADDGHGNRPYTVRNMTENVFLIQGRDFFLRVNGRTRLETGYYEPFGHSEETVTAIYAPVVR